MPSINKAVQWAVLVAADPAHGYDQQYRTGPDYDCSSFVAAALIAGGFSVSPNSWTGNLYSQLINCGFEEVAIDAPRGLGHIFLNETHHVIMCVNENQIVQASINENGETTGGRTGDQTGREIYKGSFYTPSYGWDYHLVPPSDSYDYNPVWHAKPTGGYARETQEAQDNAVLMAAILIYYGWSLKSIAAMIGCSAGESGINPWRWESDYVPTVAEAYAWTPTELLTHGYGMWQFTYFTRYVDHAQNLPGYGPNFADRQGLATDGQAQTIFMNNELPNDWTHNQYNYYYDDFIAIGVDINDFYWMTVDEFREGNDTIENLVGAYLLCFLRGADSASANSYPFRVQSAQFWYDFLLNADIPVYAPFSSDSFKIMMYLKPLWKRKRGC